MSESAELIEDVANRLEAIMAAHLTPVANTAALDEFRRETRRLMHAPAGAAGYGLDLLVYANAYFSQSAEFGQSNEAVRLRNTILGRVSLLRDSAARIRSSLKPSSDQKDY